MTIPKEKEADILRFAHAEKWPVGTIAKQLGVHHTTVSRVLEHNGIPRAERITGPSIIDPYLPLINETLKQFPSLPASRLYGMVCERGFEGCESHFRSRVAELRPKPTPEAYLRLKTLPGEQSQVDWGFFNKIQIGTAEYRLTAFVMVLSWSRRIYLEFFLNGQMSNFLRGHIGAFRAFDGVTKVLLYDNLKSAVLDRRGDAIRFNPTLLELASHYHFEPRPVAVYRGNEKGRVERAIRYVRDNFWAGRELTLPWTGIEDLQKLNEQARIWCDTTTMKRPCPEDRSLSVADAFVQEQPQLMSLPDTDYPSDEQIEVKVSKTPYVRFERNDYSVPYTQTRKSLLVVATPTEVRIMDGGELIASHTRCYDKGKQIEDPAHIKGLKQHKRAAREHSGKDRLSHAIPISMTLLKQAAEKGYSLGSIVSTLLRMLDQYGASEMGVAIEESLAAGVAHPNGVRTVLQRRREERDQPTPVPVNLEKHPQAKAVSVKAHDLSIYDQLSKSDSAGATEEIEVENNDTTEGGAEGAGQ